MANICLNTLTITGARDRLTAAYERLCNGVSDADLADEWGTIVYAMADEANIPHPEKLLLPPFNTEIALTHEPDMSQLLLQYDTKWWCEPEFMEVLAKVFRDCEVTLTVEEWADAGAAEYRWRGGTLYSERDTTVSVLSFVDEWNRIAAWSDGSWTVDRERVSLTRAMTLLTESADEDARAFVANHPSAPPRLLLPLLSDREQEVADAAFANPQLTTAHIEDAVREKHHLGDIDLADIPLDVLRRYL